MLVMPVSVDVDKMIYLFTNCMISKFSDNGLFGKDGAFSLRQWMKN